MSGRMAGPSRTIPAPDPSRTGDIPIDKGQPSGCPFLYAFMGHAPGEKEKGHTSHGGLSRPGFVRCRALTGLENAPERSQEKFFEIFFRKFFQRCPKNVMAWRCLGCAG